MLARQAVTLDHASGGRFELGIGWGSVPAEFDQFGVSPRVASKRIARFKESLDVIRALWTGEPVDYAGEYHTLAAAQQLPKPLSDLPIIIGGAGERTLQAVAKHADWWNLPIYALDKLDEPDRSPAPRLDARDDRFRVRRERAGRGHRDGREAVRLHRIGKTVTIGDAQELRAHFAARQSEASNGSTSGSSTSRPDTLDRAGRHDVIGSCCATAS
jgi:alkanesulfonate monooxygenase SsuD/methylene tetrahydromethanopterin reductase-like flavin-dependent oxidoreductase (luciferase family)